MSIQVPIPDLRSVAEGYGPTAYVVAGSASGSPRITHVTLAWADAELVVHLGRSASAAIAVNPAVTVLWPATEGEAMSLIVDGEVRVPPPADGGETRVRPITAVRHRAAPD